MPVSPPLSRGFDKWGPSAPCRFYLELRLTTSALMPPTPKEGRVPYPSPPCPNKAHVTMHPRQRSSKAIDGKSVSRRSLVQQGPHPAVPGRRVAHGASRRPQL